jgi:hypothetical protein
VTTAGQLPQLPLAIGRAVAGLSAVVACAVEGTPSYDVLGHRWVLKVALQPSASTAFVNGRTRWCVLIDEEYPFGSIAVHPASVGGLTATFQHQERNQPAQTGGEWRSGKLCLDSPLRAIRGATFPRDPVGNADERLRWHVDRALEWLGAAAAGTLVAVGDPFELPARPYTTEKDLAGIRVVHDEGGESLSSWTAQPKKAGNVVIAELPGVSTVLVVAEVKALSGASIRKWEGRRVQPVKEPPFAMWSLWPCPIVNPPWQAPGTWGALRRAGRTQGVDVDVLLKQMASRLRGTKTRGLLFLGYPMPEHVGGEPIEIHWDTVVLPKVPPASTAPRGFRANSNGWWQRDRLSTFGDTVALDYLHTENWSAARLQARGRLPPSLCGAKVAIIGVGALGSVLAEYLVRAGVRTITIFDGDALAAGNICRHAATLLDVGVNKADAVAKRLRQVSAVATVEPVSESLEGGAALITNALDDSDIVVDCTASDEALISLATGWWASPRIFASFSLGAAARRLYSYGTLGHQFPLPAFRAAIDPLVFPDAIVQANTRELYEGPGCWAPLYPARYDDISLAAAVCVKELEALIIQRPPNGRFRVFEREDRDGEFAGYASISRPEQQGAAS